MATLPAVLDIRDDLDRAREATDEDVDDDFEFVSDRLDALGERDPSNRESVLDEIDNQLLQVEARVGDRAAEYLRAARNRIGIYRDAHARGSAELSIIESRLGGESIDGPIPAELRAGAAELEALVLNEGDRQSVTVVVTLYDAESTALTRASSPAIAVDADEQRPVTVELPIPDEARFYTVHAVGEPAAPP